MKVLIVTEAEGHTRQKEELERFLEYNEIEHGVVNTLEEAVVDEKESLLSTLCNSTAIEEPESEEAILYRNIALSLIKNDLIDEDLNSKGVPRDIAGYPIIHMPTHPFADPHGYVQLHRVLMEIWFNDNCPESPYLLDLTGQGYQQKFLPISVPINHKDGDKTNFEIDNLEVLEIGDMTPNNVQRVQMVLDQANNNQAAQKEAAPTLH